MQYYLDLSPNCLQNAATADAEHTCPGRRKRATRTEENNTPEKQVESGIVDHCSGSGSKDGSQENRLWRCQ